MIAAFSPIQEFIALLILMVFAFAGIAVAILAIIDRKCRRDDPAASVAADRDGLDLEGNPQIVGAGSGTRHAARGTQPIPDHAVIECRVCGELNPEVEGQRSECRRCHSRLGPELAAARGTPRDQPLIECQTCGEANVADAAECRHCRSRLGPETPVTLRLQSLAADPPAAPPKPQPYKVCVDCGEEFGMAPTYCTGCGGPLVTVRPGDEEFDPGEGGLPSSHAHFGQEL